VAGATDYEPWICDFCTAGCTFEAMQMCARRTNLEAECGYDNDQPLALDKNGVPSREGCFEFVQLKTKVRFEGRIPTSVADHCQHLNDTMETRKS